MLQRMILGLEVISYPRPDERRTDEVLVSSSNRKAVWLSISQFNLAAGAPTVRAQSNACHDIATNFVPDPNDVGQLLSSPGKPYQCFLLKFQRSSAYPSIRYYVEARART